MFRRFVKMLLPRKLFIVIEPYGHFLESVLMNLYYRFPSRGIRVIGITGTNGKTTTSFMIHRMLVEAGYKVGLLSTVANGVGNDITKQTVHMTTLSAPQLQKRIKSFRKQGIEWLVLETTSHALAQHRVWGINFEVAVLTNVTHEHLDYHGTIEKYIAAKRMLFENAGRNARGFGVANADDAVCEDFLKAVPKGVSYGIKRGDLRAKSIKKTSVGTKYQAVMDDDSYDITCYIPGEVNVYNSLAAVAVGRHVGLSAKQVEQGIAALREVEGRMTALHAGQDFAVLVDFAHTPDAFERLLSDVRKSTTGTLIAVFGSAGRRDKSKRAIQGEIASKYCDEVVLTEEDNRDEPGNEILEEIAAGAEKFGKTRTKDLFLIPDRTKAIQFAMTRVAAKGDTVVLLGKGHEKTIERADGEHVWDEVATAKKALSNMTRDVE